MTKKRTSRNRKNIKRRKKNKISVKILSYLMKLLIKPASIVLIIIIAAFSWLYFSGNYNKLEEFLADEYNSFSKDSGLILKDILLDGHKNTPKKDIIDILTKSTLGDDKYLTKGDPLLNIDLENIQTKLNKMEWVESSTVERLFPSALSIRVVERVPVALWQSNGKMKLIDTNGEIINIDNIGDFSDLIIIVGNEAPSHANHIFQVINKEPELAKRVSSLIFISKRRWNVRLFNDIEIKLPEDNPQKAWSEIARMQKEALVLDSDISTIDMRLEDKVFIK